MTPPKADTVQITQHGADGLDDAMLVMGTAFDPRFGEAWTASQCNGVLAMPGAVLLIARDPGPVGFALLRIVAGEAELMLLGVAPSARRRGVGRQLLEQSIAAAQAQSAEHYFLEVRNDNPAIALYRLSGLQQVGCRPNYYRGKDGNSRDALTFRLTLR